MMVDILTFEKGSFRTVKDVSAQCHLYCSRTLSSYDVVKKVVCLLYCLTSASNIAVILIYYEHNHSLTVEVQKVATK
jgi:hypothetical protein